MDVSECTEPYNPPVTRWYAFVGSWFESPGQAQVLLRGDIGESERERLHEQLDTLRSIGARFITVDATGVTSCQPDILEVLGATQRHLASRRGLLTLRGLHPSILPAEISTNQDDEADASRRSSHLASPGEAVRGLVDSAASNTTSARWGPSLPGPRSELGTLSAL